MVTSPIILGPTRRSERLTVSLTAPFIAVVLLWIFVGCGGQEAPSTAPGDDLRVETPSFAPGTDIENAAGTIRVVDGLEPYRDPARDFKLEYRVIPDVYVYVIEPDADETMLLVPSGGSDEPSPGQAATAVVTAGTRQDPTQRELLAVSDMPEEYRHEGLKVVFSGKVDKRPSHYEGLNRISLQLTSIELLDSP